MTLNSMQTALAGVFARYAERPAVRGRSISWSYTELDRLSTRLAESLRERGVHAGQIVPVLMGRSALLVLTQLAIVRLGAAYSPIDMASPAPRQRAMLEAIGSRLLVGDGAAASANTANTDHFDAAAWLASQANSSLQHAGLWVAPPPDSPVYVMFTSGSTGVPKGVMVPHAGIVRLVCDAGYAHFGPEQRWGFISSPAFDLSTLEVWGALMNGGCCVVQEEAVPSLDTLGEFLVREHITDTWLTSALFNAMVEDQLPSLGGLRQLLVGGERVSARHARLMLQAHPAVRLIDGYGPTENTTFTLCHTITLTDTEGEAGVPIGRPLRATQVRVEPLDAESPRRGELWTAGDGVALGYLGDAALTAAKFVWHERRRWYRTGDLVRERDDGVFEFHGRIDRQIKLRGQRIELEEVELALTGCEGVGNGAVLVVGESADTRRIVAVYNLLAADGPTPDVIAAHMRVTLPDAAVPSEFVQLPQLPANLNGKVDRKALEAMLVPSPSVQAVPLASVATPVSTWVDVSVWERLQTHTAMSPERIALEGATERLSYRELERRSTRLAAALVDAGVSRGDRVALLLPRSIEFVLAILACVRVGAAFAPIDLASPPERIARMLGVLEPRLALVDAASAHAVPSDAHCFDLSAFDWHAERPAPAPAPVGPDDLPFCIFFTSGTTGAPKAVMVPAAGIARLTASGTHAHFGPGQRWAFLSSPAFDAASLEIWGPLLNGGCCVVQTAPTPSLQQLAAFLVAGAITDAWLTAALFNAMVQEQLPALGGLRQLLIGGERLSPQHVGRMLLAHPQTRLINGYGPTENTTFTLSHTALAADAASSAGIPIGLPLAGTQVRIEPGAGTDEGELWTAGAGVALGYFGNEAATGERFVNRDGQRWYRTGDTVRRRADGVFEFIGRVDRQVKLQGHRVEVDEVELVLAQCPGVGDAAVLLRGADAAGQHLAACYAGPQGREPPSIAQVAGYLATQLPAAAMPKVFKVVARMPVNLNGKLDRDALARALDQGTEPAVSGEQAEPMSLAETALAAIWRELIPGAGIDRDSHFLRIGGTSLLALHVASLVRKRLGRELAPVDVLRHPVLADQAAMIGRASASFPPDAVSADAALADWSIPLTRAQRNVLAATELDPTGSAYLVHVALCVPESADAPDETAWRQAFEKLAQRHPALRLLARHDDGVSRARLQTGLPEGWWRIWPMLDHAPGDLDWPADLLEQVNRPLATATAGSMRVDCWPLARGGRLVVWSVHHHVIDEASIDIALGELDALLKRHTLPPVYGSPFGFATIEAAWTDTASVDTWAERLSTALAGQAAPLPAAPAAGFERRWALTAERQTALAACADALVVTPFPILLTAYGLALQDTFGAAFRFVSTPFSRRAEPELIEPIGYLLDVRFIESGALPAEALAATLARVSEAVRAAQTPSFQSLDDLIVAVRSRDPQVAQLLTQFGFTWRREPARAVPLGGVTAQLLRVPQTGARYSICLHVAEVGGEIGCSIEAVEPAHRSGRVESLWKAFERRLDDLCALRALPATDMRIESSAVEVKAPSADDATLRALWSHWLKVPPESIAPCSHFLRSGGSSLVAMRMASELRRAAGVRLDVGAFLARPTYATLLKLARARAPERPEGFVLIGPNDFEQVMLLLPGSGGQAAGMYALADELHRRSEPGTAVAIVDLDTAMQVAPVDDPLSFVARRVLQIVRDLGAKRLVGIVGFSLGGALALQVARDLDAGIDPPVWMLDTFAPRTHRMTLARKIERRLAWQIFGGRTQPQTAEESAASGSSLSALPLRSSESLWDLLSEQLASHDLAAPRASVRLIQARQSVQASGLLRQRRNNGFVPADYASWRVHEIDGSHLDIPRQLAALTVGIIVGAQPTDAAPPA
jgi:amino acid adenylation domain-containing protein